MSFLAGECVMQAGPSVGALSFVGGSERLQPPQAWREPKASPPLPPLGVRAAVLKSTYGL